MYSSLC